MLDANVDLPDLSMMSDLSGSVDGAFSGAGGAFGGAGASGSFGVEGASVEGAATPGSSSGALDAAGGADEGLPILIAIIAVLGGLLALGFVVYSSPVLFAEVLLDVAVVGAVYRKNKRHERGHWAAGVLSRTYKPALALGVLAAAFGFAAQSTAPDEKTLGAVLEAYESGTNERRTRSRSGWAGGHYQERAAGGSAAQRSDLVEAHARNRLVVARSRGEGAGCYARAGTALAKVGACPTHFSKSLG